MSPRLSQLKDRARLSIAQFVTYQSRWILWVCAALAALPVASLLGASEATWLPSEVQTGLRSAASIEYMVVILMVYAAVVHIRDSALETLLTFNGVRDPSLGLSASDTGWVFWAAAASLACLAVVMRMAPQNIKQEIYASGDEIIWSGAISRRSPDIEQMVSDGASVVRLLNNRGGDVEVASDVAARLMALGVTAVIADGQCASSCAHLWLLSPGRTLAPYSVIGLHLGQGTRYENGRRIVDPVLTREINKELEFALVEAGATPDTAAAFIAASHSKMNWLSARDLRAAGIRFRDLSEALVE